jgi:hypothetical protein
MWGNRYFNFPGSQHERLCDWIGLQGPPETDIVAGLTENAARATAIVDPFERGDLTPWIIENASASHAGSAAHDARHPGSPPLHRSRSNHPDRGPSRRASSPSARRPIFGLSDPNVLPMYHDTAPRLIAA